MIIFIHFWMQHSEKMDVGAPTTPSTPAAKPHSSSLSPESSTYLHLLVLLFLLDKKFVEDVETIYYYE